MPETNARDQADVCGIGSDGFKCAVVSWVMPLIVAVVLLLGMHFPVLRVFNIVFVAFGLLALFRSVAHLRRFGACGMGGHIAAGVALNALVLTLIALYVFTGFDPLSVRAD